MWSQREPAVTDIRKSGRDFPGGMGKKYNTCAKTFWQDSVTESVYYLQVSDVGKIYETDQGEGGREKKVK